MHVAAGLRCRRGCGTQTVRCRSGRAFRYSDVVLAPGLVPDEDELADVFPALDSEAVASNYLDHAEKTWQLVESMDAGHAVFTVPRPPVSCTGTTLKPLFLAEAYWWRMGCIDDIDITLVVDRPDLVGVAAIDDRLRRCLDEIGVQVMNNATVTAVDPAERKLLVRVDGVEQRLPYDLLHLVPPFRGPRWIESSGLAAMRRTESSTSTRRRSGIAVTPTCGLWETRRMSTRTRRAERYESNPRSWSTTCWRHARVVGSPSTTGTRWRRLRPTRID